MKITQNEKVNLHNLSDEELLKFLSNMEHVPFLVQELMKRLQTQLDS